MTFPALADALPIPRFVQRFVLGCHSASAIQVCRVRFRTPQAWRRTPALLMQEHRKTLDSICIEEPHQAGCATADACHLSLL